MAITKEDTGSKTHVIVKCQAGDVLLKENETGGQIFLLKEGVLELSKEKDGKPVIIGQIGPGNMVGHMHMVDGLPQNETVTALQDCILFQLSRDKFSQTLTAQPEWYQTLVKTLVERIRKTSKKQIGLN